MNTRRVLVTGASAGIGRHAALRLAREGWEVFAAARRSGALVDLAKEAAGIHPIVLDVASSASIRDATAEIFARTDGYGVDALVNNAGIAIVGPLAEVSDEDFRAQFDTNVLGLMSVTRAFLPTMMGRRAGRIVNVSSSGGRISLPFVGVYHATKFALEALSDTARWELAPFGIRVSLIEPGPIRTELGDKMIASLARISAESAYAPVLRDVEGIKRFAEGRMHGPEIVVRDIVHALTSRHPRARYVQPRSLSALLKLYWLSPTWLTDWVITRFAGLTRARLLGQG